MGFEPATHALRKRCSTPELHRLTLICSYRALQASLTQPIITPKHLSCQAFSCSRKSRANPPGHQIAVMILEAKLAIERLPCCVGTLDLKMESMNAKFGAHLQDKLYSFRPYPLIAVGGCDEKLINKGIAPVVFETIAKRYDEVSNGFIFMVY